MSLANWCRDCEKKFKRIGRAKLCLKCLSKRYSSKVWVNWMDCVRCNKRFYKTRPRNIYCDECKALGQKNKVCQSCGELCWGYNCMKCTKKNKHRVPNWKKHRRNNARRRYHAKKSERT